MSSYDKAVGGKLKLKGGLSLQKTDKDIVKKKKKKKKQALANPEGAEGGHEGAEGQGEKEGQGEAAAAGGIDITAPGKGYEQLFPFEKKRMEEAKGRGQCWGTNYRQAPEILHGYDRKVTGDTVEERLDMRCGQKADKFCK